MKKAVSAEILVFRFRRSMRSSSFSTAFPETRARCDRKRSSMFLTFGICLSIIFEEIACASSSGMETLSTMEIAKSTTISKTEIEKLFLPTHPCYKRQSAQ